MPVKHLRIHGTVQGVGFRYTLAREAQRAGVTGWVRNLRDGTVEAVVAGEELAVRKVIEWSRRGQPGARVTRVEISDDEGEFTEFEIRD